jgi:electron transfer flavoprotein beta subunit
VKTVPDIVVLVSGGRHPISGRPRRAANDARALELALRTAACGDPGAKQTGAGAGIRVLHAGAASLPALRGYLGMGIPGLHVLNVAPECDIVPALTETLRRWRPSLILTGVRTEAGWSSGCLPYVLAEALGYTLVPNIETVTMTAEGDTIALRQVCPRGRRRSLQARQPVIATVDPAAPAPRQSAFAKERRGRLLITDWSGTAHAATSPGEVRPARRRPRRLQKPVGGDTAAARLQALTQTAGGGGQILEPGSPGEAALAIYTYLVEQGVLDSARSPRTDTAPGG